MMIRNAASIGIVCASLLGTSRVSTQAETYWPGWLGPNRDGWVAGFEAPSEWPQQLNRVWQVAVGHGYGTPLVAEGRIYQHARVGNDEVLWCLEQNTGKVLWRQATPMPFKMGGGGEAHGKGPKSNALFADGRIFTLSITGVLNARTASTGELLWSKDYSEQFEKSHPYWGASTSPLVDEDRVFVHFGGDDVGTLVAMDVHTGEVVWTYGNDGAAYASPHIAEFQGIRQVVEWNHNDLCGVDSRTGHLLWRYHLPHVGTNQNMPTPAIYGGRVLVGGENRGVRSIEPKLENGLWTVTENWHQKTVSLDMSSAIVNGNHLYGFSHYKMGQLFCLDARTGKVLWTGDGRSGDNATFLAIPDHVIALLDDGELQVLRADGDQTEVVVSYQVGDSPTWSAPVLLDDGFLIKEREQLSFWALPGLKPVDTAPAR